MQKTSTPSSSISESINNDFQAFCQKEHQQYGTTVEEIMADADVCDAICDGDIVEKRAAVSAAVEASYQQEEFSADLTELLTGEVPANDFIGQINHRGFISMAEVA